MEECEAVNEDDLDLIASRSCILDVCVVGILAFEASTSSVIRKDISNPAVACRMNWKRLNISLSSTIELRLLRSRFPCFNGTVLLAGVSSQTASFIKPVQPLFTVLRRKDANKVLSCSAVR